MFIFGFWFIVISLVFLFLFFKFSSFIFKFLIGISKIFSRIYQLVFLKKYEKLEVSNNGFSQNGVTVNVKEKTLKMPSGEFYSLCDVRSMRCERDKNSSVTFIELPSFKSPIQAVHFLKPGQAEEFVSRLQTAISNI